MTKQKQSRNESERFDQLETVYRPTNQNKAKQNHRKTIKNHPQITTKTKTKLKNQKTKKTNNKTKLKKEINTDTEKEKIATKYKAKKGNKKNNANHRVHPSNWRIAKFCLCKLIDDFTLTGRKKKSSTNQ